MKFKLTYEGEIPSGRSKIANEKMKIRKCFHVQLKRLWETNHFLMRGDVYSDEAPEASPGITGRMVHRGFSGENTEIITMQEAIARQNENYGYRFVPLTRKSTFLHCFLEILLLRSDGLIRTVSAGDLDNRVKTIVDALRQPRNVSELGDYQTPEGDENPFFVLLEDDELVSKLVVESGELLSPNKNGNYHNNRWAKVVVSAEVIPFRATLHNLSYI